MSDFNYRSPEDPFRHDTRTDFDARTANTMWGWIAAAVFVVVILAVAFGLGHQAGPNGTNVATNSAAPPAATRMTAPAPTPSPAISPTPANPAPPVAPAPNEPAHDSNGTQQ